MRRLNSTLAHLAALGICCGLIGMPAPARAMTMAQIGQGSCSTAAYSCSITATGNLAPGGTVLLIGEFANQAPTSITVSDSAGNCGSAYSVKSASQASGIFTTVVAAFCTLTTSAIVSGITTFTLAYTGGGIEPFNMVAYSVTGNSQTAFFDKQGTQAAAQWTSGIAVAGAISGTPAWTSEDAIVVIDVPSSAPADTIGFTGGVTAIGAFPPASTNRPGLWIGKATITGGTMQSGFTPTSAAARYYLAQIFMFVNAGAIPSGRRSHILLGVGQ